jgi:nicotinamidase-related amidase
VDVAHPTFWKNSKGEHPKPFTIITSREVKDGVWTPCLPGCFQRMADYVTALEKGGRYPLCIWPPHCLIGGPGATIVPELTRALDEWCSTNLSTIDYVAKGSNPFTEHYSAIQAEVPDPCDPKTSINAEFVRTLMEADLIAVAGEAGSHCLANTVRDIVTQFQDDQLVAKIVLLEDATSPVPGFENLYTQFRDEMTARGMKIATTADFLN